MPSGHVYFIAHASADHQRARELRDLLHPDVPAFLAPEDLLPGDDWPQVLSRAQQAAAATVALISSHSDGAYYLGEELAAAIAYRRAAPDQHRLIPVYLDGFPSDPQAVPYGLRVKHALDASRLGGLAGVAAELKRIALGLAPRTGPAAALAPAYTPPAPPPVDPQRLLDGLERLLDAQFEEVLFRVDAPLAHLPPRVVERSTRAISLIQWARAQGPTTLAAVSEAVRRFVAA